MTVFMEKFFSEFAKKIKMFDNIKKSLLVCLFSLTFASCSLRKIWLSLFLEMMIATSSSLPPNPSEQISSKLVFRRQTSSGLTKYVLMKYADSSAKWNQVKGFPAILYQPRIKTQKTFLYVLLTNVWKCYTKVSKREDIKIYVSSSRCGKQL